MVARRRAAAHARGLPSPPRRAACRRVARAARRPRGARRSWSRRPAAHGCGGSARGAAAGRRARRAAAARVRRARRVPRRSADAQAVAPAGRPAAAGQRLLAPAAPRDGRGAAASPAASRARAGAARHGHRRRRRARRRAAHRPGRPPDRPPDHRAPRAAGRGSGDGMPLQQLTSQIEDTDAIVTVRLQPRGVHAQQGQQLRVAGRPRARLADRAVRHRQPADARGGAVLRHARTRPSCPSRTCASRRDQVVDLMQIDSRAARAAVLRVTHGLAALPLRAVAG